MLEHTEMNRDLLVTNVKRIAIVAIDDNDAIDFLYRGVDIWRPIQDSQLGIEINPSLRVLLLRLNPCHATQRFHFTPKR